jgi:hypothetical protein
VGSVVVLELLHGQDTIVIRIVVAIAESSDGSDGAEKDCPLVRSPVHFHGTHETHDEHDTWYSPQVQGNKEVERRTRKSGSPDRKLTNVYDKVMDLGKSLEENLEKLQSGDAYHIYSPLFSTSSPG